MGRDLPWILEQLKNNSITKKYAVPFIHWAGMQALKKSAEKPSWKNVWSAGQSVGLIESELSCHDIMDKFVSEYISTTKTLSGYIHEN